MCFNATASFVASGGLAVAGAASLHLADKRQKVIAIIPLIFAVQQAVEGYQWLSIGNGATCTVAGYGFLFFAFLLWPLYLPIMVYILDEERRWAMRWLIPIGLVVTAYLLGVLLFEPLVIRVINHSLQYQVSMPFSKIMTALYVLVTCGSLLFSSKQYVRWLGATILLSGVIAVTYFAVVAVSVWCFFAAVISLLICLFLWHDKLERTKKNNGTPVGLVRT